MWSNVNTTLGSSQGGFMDSSTIDGDQKPTEKRSDNLVPVMIGHLNKAKGEELTIWGKPVRVVTFLGTVKEMTVLTTKISYEIEDETGRITALKWLEAGKTYKELDNIVESTYVRIFGVLREQAGKRNVLILHIRQLEEINELTNHLLEVIYTFMQAESLSKHGSVNSTNHSVVPSSSYAEEAPLFGMSREQSIIYKIIQAENAIEPGIERSEIIERAPKHLQPHVNRILDFLSCEGHIYTTSTDDHFKST